MTFPFPVPCPVCGADDEHAAWRIAHPADGISATYCPHPGAGLGHGTGCCCGGGGYPTPPIEISPGAFIEVLPSAADMRYEDEDANRVARVLVRVEWAGGKIREYEAAEPEAFEMNDPENEMPRMVPMRMAVQTPGSPAVQMMAAVPSLRLSFTPHPRRNMVIRTERTAAPSVRESDEGQAPRFATGGIVADSGDGKGDQLPPLLQGRVDLIDQPQGFQVHGGLGGGDG